MVFGEKIREDKTKIREIIEVFLERMKKEIKKKVFERINVGGGGCIERNEFRDKIRKETDIREVFLQCLRAREDE